MQLANLSAEFLDDELEFIVAFECASVEAFVGTGLLPQFEILASKSRDLGYELRELLTQLRERWMGRVRAGVGP